MHGAHTDDGLITLSGPVRDWFAARFPAGPTPAQSAVWPRIAAREHTLLVSPTGTGKTLAGFLAIIDRLIREQRAGTLQPGLRGVYISPLRSLGYDIERNLAEPLEALRRSLGLDRGPIEVGVRTGDTSSHARRKLRDRPPHLLITTPESLALLLSQETWLPSFRTVEHVLVDEIHSLVPTKRGADLAVSLERLTSLAAVEPCRVGLSATCRPAEPVARFLVGPGRNCHVVEAAEPAGHRAAEIEVETLIEPDEAPHRNLSYRRLLKRLRRAIAANRTTVVFANTRAFTERITHDLRRTLDRDGEGDGDAVAAHHSALDAARRRDVEASLKSGELRAVVTSTSLELGVDIGTADLTVMVGLPGSVSRCLQRTGRSGHRVGATTRGLILAATPAELAGAVVTAEAARRGRIEPLRGIRNPLDVLCQQVLGMACAGEQSVDSTFDLIRRSAPFADLERSDFDACLDFLAGELAAPPGAFEPEPGATPRWTAPRLWKVRGLFGVRNRRVIRWFRANVGTILAEAASRVVVDGREIGSLEGAYAERLQAGDRFVLDGRALEFRRLEAGIVHARPTGGDPDLPRWTSDRQTLSAELARALFDFRERSARILTEGPSAFKGWLLEAYGLDPEAAAVLLDLFEAQARWSEIPRMGTVLVEEFPHPQGVAYGFHVPLGRAGCEALGRAVAARLGRRFGRNLSLQVADLGWAIHLDGEGRLEADDLSGLFDPADFETDVLEGLDRGELIASRFRNVAATAMMVLKNPEGGRIRVGGLLWVSRRLYPLVRAACPDHPLVREARRETLEDVLDAPGAKSWLLSRPEPRFRRLEGVSPFTAAWITVGGPEPIRFEPPEEALRRLHARIMARPGAHDAATEA